MSDPAFFARPTPATLADVIDWTGARGPEGADPTAIISGIAPLEAAGPGDLAYCDNPKYADALATTRATACLLSDRFAERTRSATIALICADPYRAFATAAARLYPDAARPGSMFGGSGVSPGASVHPEARLEDGVTVDPGAVIGAGARIGAGTVVGANAVIASGVRIGRDCSIGPNCSIQHALVGDRVIVHPGARIGQDGFGFAMGPKGHLKVPQIGRVVIQNDVEIGANTTIDRGASRDTTIGEGAKIDNLVQIAHNVTIGRHCIIVSQSGISGSTDVGDFAALGGQAGLTGHLKIGVGAQISAQAGVMTDVPAGARFGGSPAMPMREHFRRLVELDRLVKKSAAGKTLAQRED